MSDTREILQHIIAMSDKIGRFEANQAVQSQEQQRMADVLERHMCVEEEIQKDIYSKLRELARRVEDIPHEEHNEDHAYLSQMRDREVKKTKFWENVSVKVTTGGILAVLMAMGSVTWYAFSVYTGGEIPVK